MKIRIVALVEKAGRVPIDVGAVDPETLFTLANIANIANIAKPHDQLATAAVPRLSTT